MNVPTSSKRKKRRRGRVILAAALAVMLVPGCATFTAGNNKLLGLSADFDRESGKVVVDRR